MHTRFFSGKLIIASIITIFLTTLLISCPDPIPLVKVLPVDPSYIGWATVGDGTYGGSDLEPVTVTTKSGFASAISGNRQKVIIVDGSGGVIDLGMGTVYLIGSNKTIRGINNAVLQHGNLKLLGVNNVIIQNLTVCDAVDPNPTWDSSDGWNNRYDCISVEGSSHIWIDHVEIYNTVIDEDDYIAKYGSLTNYSSYCWYDGLLDITKGANYITVSNCNIHHNSKTCLLGSTDDHDYDVGKLKVTWFGNYFHDAGSRIPRVRFGQVHVFNNYYENITDYALGRGDHCSIYSENNYFNDVYRPVRAYDDIANRGYVYDTGSATENCNMINLAPTDPAMLPLIADSSSWDPSTYYTYTADTADAAMVTAITTNAGPQP
ncbi:MAG: hypothetical protein JW904_14250 [Spirochaetales bacterium]|nr:hypothetical protein [Spirochaetales bacterium]